MQVNDRAKLSSQWEETYTFIRIRFNCTLLENANEFNLIFVFCILFRLIYTTCNADTGSYFKYNISI